MRGSYVGVSLLAAIALLPAACGTAERTAHADTVAETVGMTRSLVSTKEFVLTAYSRLGSADSDVHIYIEGDGRAWLSPTQPSSDPTPRQALGLELAAEDTSPNVIYIARPCQFTPRDLNPLCDVPYWTSRRFSEEVIASMDEAVDGLVSSRPGTRLDLIGYSGGGAVAILLAARRSDVATIRTIAGNLDTEEVNRLHDVSSMPDSLNPIDQAKTVARIPQIHFSGGDDETVPRIVADRFRQAAGGDCVAVETVPNATHETGWVDAWSALLSRKPRCGS